MGNKLLCCTVIEYWKLHLELIDLAFNIIITITMCFWWEAAKNASLVVPVYSQIAKIILIFIKIIPNIVHFQLCLIFVRPSNNNSADYYFKMIFNFERKNYPMFLI